MLCINKCFFVGLIDKANKIASERLAFDSTIRSNKFGKLGLLTYDAQQSVSTVKMDGDMLARIEIKFELLFHVNWIEKGHEDINTSKM